MAIVTNTEARLLTIRLAGDPDTIQLVPGPNNVPDEAWAQAKTHPTVQKWLAAERLIEGRVRFAPSAFGPAAPLPSPDPAEAPAPDPAEAGDGKGAPKGKAKPGAAE